MAYPVEAEFGGFVDEWGLVNPGDEKGQEGVMDLGPLEDILPEEAPDVHDWAVAEEVTQMNSFLYFVTAC